MPALEGYTTGCCSPKTGYVLRTVRVVLLLLRWVVVLRWGQQRAGCRWVSKEDFDAGRPAAAAQAAVAAAGQGTGDLQAGGCWSKCLQ